MDWTQLLEAWLDADYRDAHERLADLNPYRIAAPSGNVAEGPAVGLAADLLDVDEAVVLATRSAAPTTRYEDAGDWCSDLRSGYSGDFAVRYEAIRGTVSGRSAGVVWVESEFDDRAFHPRVGAGDSSTVLRIFDLDAGWGVALELHHAAVAIAADEAATRRIEDRVRAHLGYTVRHFSAWDHRDRDDDDAIVAWVTTVAARLDPASGEPDAVAVNPGPAGSADVSIAATVGRGSVTLDYRQSHPTDLGLAFLQVTATPDLIDAVEEEFRSLFSFAGPRDAGWVDRQVALMRAGMARASTSATERAKAVRAVQPAQPDAALVMAMALVTSAPLDDLPEPARSGYEAEFVRGRVAMLGHRYAEAVALFGSALAIRPTDPQAHYYAGAALEALGRKGGSPRTAEAAAHYHAVLAADADWAARRIDTRPGFPVPDLRADARRALERLEGHG